MKSLTNKLIIFSILIIIIGLLMCMIGGIIGFNYNFFGDRNIETVNVEKQFENVNNLMIDIEYGYVNIKTGNEFKIVADVPKNIDFESYVENGKLVIKDSSNISIIKFGVINSDYNIDIYIPENYSFNEVSINVGACDFKAENINSERVNIEVGLGKLKIDSYNSNITNISCGIGEVILNVDGNKSEYNYDVQVGIGEVVLEDEKFSGIGHQKQIKNNNSDKAFNIECGIGKVDLNFKGE